MAHRTPDPRDTDARLQRWLAAEVEERDLDAEAALTELFGSLPQPAPQAGFADRVMLAVAVSSALAASPAAARGFFASRWLRAALALALLMAGVLTAWVPGAALALLDMVSVSDVTGLARRALAACVQAVAAGCQVVLHWDALGRTVALVLSIPQVTASLAGCLLLSAVAFYLLQDLLTNRSWSHVHTI
jgi:hypothetical protein